MSGSVQIMVPINKLVPRDHFLRIVGAIYSMMGFQQML